MLLELQSVQQAIRFAEPVKCHGLDSRDSSQVADVDCASAHSPGGGTPRVVTEVVREHTTRRSPKIPLYRDPCIPSTPPDERHRNEVQR